VIAESRYGKTIHLDIEGEKKISRADELRKMMNPAFVSDRDVEKNLSQDSEINLAGSNLLAVKQEPIQSGSHPGELGYIRRTVLVMQGIVEFTSIFAEPEVLN
jgi:hypothetical protein